ncbi:MAG: glycosyltransferase family protein [Planctomycetota bacterium]
MTRIVYGIAGEGSGHSSRAREVLPHLFAQGHEVRAVSYDRGYRNLCDDFDVFETEGLHITTQDNRVHYLRTFVDNLRRAPGGIQKLRALRQELFRDFRPHCVITDFEPMTAYLALVNDLPLITLDNQHRMRYMRYPCPMRLRRDALVTETVIRAMVPRPSVSLITTFYFGPLKNERSFLFPPILRREVREMQPGQGEHVLVYSTQAFETLLEVLKDFPRERFLVYGSDRAEGEETPFHFRGFSYEGFLNDLATAKAVISTAGFSLMTESIHLGKPMLAVPMRGQFEQELNALLLEDAGYGMNGRDLDARTVESFLYRLPDYQEALAGYRPSDNLELLTKLDELVENDARRARDYHVSRQRRESPQTTSE